MSDYNTDEGDTKESPTDSFSFDLREQDRYLPIANVGRVMRNALPPHGKLSKEAKETVQECVSEFISFVTSQAAEKCSIEKRKTLNGEDILFAMYTLGFENYSETLKIYLTKYREFEQYELELKKNSNKPKRPYHRKNPKNRPKNSNRFTTSKSPTDGQDYAVQNNLPTLVPTSLLSLSHDHNIPNPTHQQASTNFSNSQNFNMEGISPTSYANSSSNNASAAVAASGYYTYANQTSDSSKISSEEGSEDGGGANAATKLFDKYNINPNDGDRRSTSGSSGGAGNLVNYGDFMNL